MGSGSDYDLFVCPSAYCDQWFWYLSAFPNGSLSADRDCAGKAETGFHLCAWHRTCPCEQPAYPLFHLSDDDVNADISRVERAFVQRIAAYFGMDAQKIE